MLERLSLLLFAGTFALSASLPEGVTNTQNALDQPLPPSEALKKISVPDGFRLTLFAAEPDLFQPVAFDFDDRGRIWVVECFSYPDFKTENKDRVLIFTDTNNDGQFDERKVFLDNGRRLSGIAWGFGGIWLCSPPELIFIADRDGDDVPDGKPVVHLDGWTLKAGHNMFNGLAWGPDGWLYGRQGILANSLVGRPGTPEKERTLLNCSIWRYHPTRHVFEVVAHGTTNPWGMDWDDHGQAFFSNNVIGHLWHLIAGAHYQRMYGEDFNPYLYELMPACSDHLHFTGGDWTKSRSGQGEHGGGHSHCGGMIYLGDNWPREYRQTMMMVNTHGRRLLYDKLERSGCGYVAKHGKSFLMAKDPWFRGISIHYGPDGGVFVTDWNDFGECHDYDGTYRSSGRMYKITYGAARLLGPFNLATLPDRALVQLQLSQNDWFVRHARRLLQERAAAGTLENDTRSLIARILDAHEDITRNLRALWALHAIGGADPEVLQRLLKHENEHMRWWAIKLSADSRPQLQEFVRLAREDKSGLVRLGLASALQRLPLNDRWELAQALASRSEDANDPNQPLMIWYGIEPAVPKDTQRAIALMAASKIPLVRQFIARRLVATEASEADKNEDQPRASLSR
jgi:putative membrane-bound dehydrogenase-like protein